ncbi:MAG: acyltransferase [Candidatus Dadabacteria bacterium]|nr:MAG: acyltransferase [Candidatus Dadabacteria bacterium]
MSIEIHPDARVSPLADLEPSVRGSRYIIGAGSVIDAFVKFKPAGGTGDIIIGNNSYINSGTVLYSGNGIAIGNNVLIAANCTLAPTNHAWQDRQRPVRDQGFAPSKGGITIEDDVWIGAGCTVLDGAHIGTGCIIAAMTLVREKLEPYGIYAGIPARKIGDR